MTMSILVFFLLFVCQGLATSILREPTSEQDKMKQFQQDIVQLENELEYVKEEVKFLEKVSVQRINEGKCNHLLVSGDNPVPDSKITASSSHDSNHIPPRSRIYSTGILSTDNTVGSWSAGTNDKHQWLEFDLGKIRTITGIITKGRSSQSHVQFVKSYEVYYGQKKLEWHAYMNQDSTYKIFEGNFDGETAKINVLDPPITAQYIRINPQTWYGHISMRADLLGCV